MHRRFIAYQQVSVCWARNCCRGAQAAAVGSCATTSGTGYRMHNNEKKPLNIYDMAAVAHSTVHDT